jgi:hypothetical protein
MYFTNKDALSLMPFDSIAPLTLPSPRLGEGRVRGASCQKIKCVCINTTALSINCHCELKPCK